MLFTTNWSWWIFTLRSICMHQRSISCMESGKYLKVEGNRMRVTKTQPYAESNVMLARLGTRKPTSMSVPTEYWEPRLGNKRNGEIAAAL